MTGILNLKSLAIWAILAAIVLIPFFLFGDSIDCWIKRLLDEYSGNTAVVALILFCVLASDIFLPVPSCLLSALCGAFLGMYFGFAVSFAAMTVSGVAGFLIGRTASPLSLKLMGDVAVGLASSEKSTPFTVFVFRPVPVLAECSCIYAGLKRCNFAKTFLWLSLGNAVVSAVYAVIGHYGRANDSFVPAFAAVMILSGAGFVLGKLIAKS